MAKKTAPEKIAAMLERVNELVDDIEIDAKLAIEEKLAVALLAFAASEEDVRVLAKDTHYENAVNADFLVGISFVAEMIRDHNFDY